MVHEMDGPGCRSVREWINEIESYPLMRFTSQGSRWGRPTKFLTNLSKEPQVDVAGGI